MAPEDDVVGPGRHTFHWWGLLRGRALELAPGKEMKPIFKF